MMRIIVRISLISILIACSGCSWNKKYSSWFTAQFTQATALEPCSPCIAKEYVRSADIYDGFNTVGHYDALWYSTPVRAHHIEAIGHRIGWSSEKLEERLRKESAEDRTKISMYILTTIGSGETMRPRIHRKQSENDTATWSIVLKIGNDEYDPLSIKKVMLPSELIASFEERYDHHFRDTYLLTFPRRICGTDLLTRREPLILQLRNTKYTVTFCWETDLVTATQTSTLLNPEHIALECQDSHLSLGHRSPMSVEELRV